MMDRILAGIETEYGLLVEGRGAEDQIDDSQALVRAYPGPCFVGWDYRFESPRADLRGFTQKSLSFDPEDAKFDVGRTRAGDLEIRSDRVLPSGARLYNDHGHPEYSTPECLSLRELALHDSAGEIAVLSAARAFSEQTGKQTWIYKNNTDYHGASYGTHENYLVPRRLGFEKLYKAVMPMLIARQILCGAGKVGAESGGAVRYQLSQRADFFTEAASVDTLYRRPVFNTRDEPHANPTEWIRLHVIAGDANMMPVCTSRKAGLLKIALSLGMMDESPEWDIPDPMRAFREVSHDESRAYRIELKGKNWTTAYDILDSYLCAFDSAIAEGEADPELRAVMHEAYALMSALREGADVSRYIDWAAKEFLLKQYVESEGVRWDDPALKSFDLEYSNVDRDQSLYWALVDNGSIDELFSIEDRERRLETVFEPTRALARGLAVSKFSDRLLGVSWASLTFRGGSEPVELYLPPNREYSLELHTAGNVERFIEMVRNDYAKS
jgi:Pup amidohydrolase